MIPFSVLDLAPIIKGGDAGSALQNTLALAQHAEQLGYHRYWLAEHHNMTGVASAATAIVIGQVAAVTKTMRVGAGGVMLPNHAPLIIAEQFGTLESLFPGRIDLGVGRAPGTDPVTTRALRRNFDRSSDTFARDVLELQSYFRDAEPDQAVKAIPGVGLNVPIWMLGSSLYSAQLAASLGLPFAFASHFAPDALMTALRLYREGFQPSAALEHPKVMLGVHIVTADSETQAKRIFTSVEQQFLNMHRGRPGPLEPPLETMDSTWSAFEEAHIRKTLSYAFVGGRESVQRQLQRFIRATGADEIIIVGHIFEHQARLRSFEIAAEIVRSLES